MDGPNYEKYTLEELYEARAFIDAEAYPDRAAELDRRIEYRVNHPEQVQVNQAEAEFPLKRVADGPLAGKPYAPFFARLAADLIDGVILFFCALGGYLIDRYLLGINSFLALRDEADQFGLADATTIAVFLYNMTYLVGRYGISWGRRVVGVQVLSMAGRPIGFFRSLGRNLFAAFISGIFYLGFLWMVVDKKKQTWHDKVFRTYVVLSEEA